MKENEIMVTSAVNNIVVIDLPEIPLRRTWNRAGASFPIDRELLMRAYYDPAVESLFRSGLLTTTDKAFLKEIGLLDEEDTPVVAAVSETLFNRMIKLMPLTDFKTELKKFSAPQIELLAEYAIEHYIDLKLDRVDILSKVSGKNILKAIENYKASLED